MISCLVRESESVVREKEARVKKKKEAVMRANNRNQPITRWTKIQSAAYRHGRSYFICELS